MSVIGRYLSAIPATTVIDEEQVEFPHMLPLWYYVMAHAGLSFKDAVVGIRQGWVRMLINNDRPVVTASAHLLRELKEADKEHREQQETPLVWKGNLTNPDTVVFCRLTELGLDSLDEIKLRWRAGVANTKGLLTEEQFDGLPELYQQVLDRNELPVVIISDAAGVWFEQP